MTSMKKGRLAIAAMAAVGALVLAGCGSDAETTAEDAASPSVTMSEETEMEMPGADATAGDLEITGVWVRESSLDLSGGFGKVTNNGDADDALVAVTAVGIPEVQLHETVDGVMQQVPSFPVPAGGTLVLQPGGNHLMFMGLTEPIEAGSTVELTLEFESGATASLEAPVNAFTMGDDMGHSDN